MTKSLNTQANIEVEIANDVTTVTHPLLSKEPLTYKTSDISRSFYGSMPDDSGLLPPVVRYLSADLSAFIVERPPFMAKITYQDACTDSCDREDEMDECEEHDGEITEYTIPVPWTVYAIKFTKDGDQLTNVRMNLWYRNRQIFTVEDELFLPTLPNIYEENASVCLGNVILKFDASKQSTEQILNTVINNFWESKFNNELSLPSVPESYDGSWSIPKLLDWLSEHSIDEVIEFEYKSILNNQWLIDLYPKYSELKKHAKKYTSIGDVIDKLDRTTKSFDEEVILNDPNPLLAFFKKITHGLETIDLTKYNKAKSPVRKKKKAV